MRDIFVDTSAWAAIEDTTDANYWAALDYQDYLISTCHLVTSSAVLDESYTLLLMNVGYLRTVSFKNIIDLMAETAVLTVVHVSESIEEEAWTVFERFNVDKRWSFTDCTSKVIMEQRGIHEVFTFDHHFEQMGFTRKP